MWSQKPVSDLSCKRVFVFDYRLGMEMAVRANGGRYAALNAGQATGLNPLWTEIDERGQSWLADWLASLLYCADKPLTPAQTNRIQEVVRQNASDADLRNWHDLASLFISADDDGDLHERLQEWTADSLYLLGTKDVLAFLAIAYGLRPRICTARCISQGAGN